MKLCHRVPFSFPLQGRIVNNNTIPAGASISEGQQFLIHEEGDLERWFNLTITNVGLESVADYTCVAVNAGGVMEENISLTFEEPEPVSWRLHFKCFDRPINIFFRRLFSLNECHLQWFFMRRLLVDKAKIDSFQSLWDMFVISSIYDYYEDFNTSREAIWCKNVS